MASKDNIKGLTVEIGGDVTPLEKALKSSETAAKASAAELKKVNAALKLDPTNVVLLTQKQTVLGEQIEATRKKLEVLRAGEEAAQKAVAEGAEGSEAALRDLQREIVFSTSKLDSLYKQSYTTAEALKSAGKNGAAAQKDVKNAAEKTEQSVRDVGDAAQDSGGKVSSFGDVLKGSLAADVISSACRTVVSGIREIGSAVSEQLDTLGDLDDNAQKVGMSAEALQEWQYAAKLGGMESETLVKALEKQQKSFADAKTGSASLAESYAALGVNVEMVGSSEDALNAVIDALADLDDETQRNALANDIFGKSYAELAPLLNFGSEGIAELRQEARDLGLVLSNETVAATAEAGDSVDRLTGMIDTAKSSILAGMLPSLSKVADSLREKLNTTQSQKQLKKLGAAAGDLAEDAAELAIKLLPKLASAMQTVSKHGTTVFTVLTSGLVTIKGFRIGSSITGLIPRIQSLWAAISANPVGAVITVLGALITTLGALDLASDSALEKQEALAESYRTAADAAAEAAADRARIGSENKDEMRHYDDLIAELGDLVEADGSVKKAYQERVEYILGELSEAAGEEITMVDGVIERYSTLGKTIRDTILMQQAEDYLSSQKSNYDSAKEAINSLETDEDGNYAAGSLAAVEAARANAQYWAETAAKMDELDTKMDEAYEAMKSAEDRATRDKFEAQLYGLEAQYYELLEIGRPEELQTAAQNAQAAYDAAKYAYDQNLAAVAQYDAVQDAVWSQSIQRTSAAMETATDAMLNAGTASLTSLQRQEKDAIETYEQFKAWAAQSGSSVTAEQVKARGERALEAAAQTMQKMIDEGDAHTQEEINAAREQVAELFVEVRGESLEDLDEYLEEVHARALQTGAALVDGITTGIRKSRQEAVLEVRKIGISSLDELRKTWEIASPSKASARAAAFFTEGVRRQFVNDAPSTLETIRRYAADIRDTFDSGMTLTAVEQAAYGAEFWRTSSDNVGGGSFDLNAICTRLDRISARLDEMETTMILDDGTLIARTDYALGQTAALNTRGDLTNV